MLILYYRLNGRWRVESFERGIFWEATNRAKELKCKVFSGVSDSKIDRVFVHKSLHYSSKAYRKPALNAYWRTTKPSEVPAELDLLHLLQGGI